MSYLFLLWYVLFLALFRAAIRRDSVSLFRLPAIFLATFTFPSDISLVSRLKFPHIPFLFSSYFFLLILVWSVLFLVAVINLPLRLSTKYSSRCIKALTLSSMLVSPLPTSFLNTYSLSTSSLGWKALCIVISLLFWSICLCSSLATFKNRSEFHTWVTVRYLSLL